MSSYMHTHIYADERAREFEVAGRERQMGCSPLCGMLSKVVMKCNGRQGRTRKEKLDYAMAYPPVQTCYMRPPVASNHAIPVTAQFTPTPGAGAPPPRARGGKPRKRKKSKHVRFNPAGPGPGPGPAQHPAGPRPAQPPHAAHAYQQYAAGTSGGDQSQQQHHAAVASGPYYSGPATPGDSGYGSYSYGGYYAPSPLTRWEMLGGGGAGTTPRRHYEYFSGEYRWSYPTPVRQGIYSMATDANRLTAIFSEENPNACAIV